MSVSRCSASLLSASSQLLRIMPPFTMEMATSAPAPPTVPSPEPEGRVATPPVVEPPVPETDVERIRCAWAVVLVSLNGYGHAHPDLKQELLEDLETWQRGWNHVLVDMVACSAKARPFDLKLQLSKEELELFNNTKHWAAVATKTVCNWKKMAEELMVHAEELRIPCAEKAPARTEESEDGQRVVGCMSVGNFPRCERCVERKITCVPGKNVRCQPCTTAHKTCTFTAAKGNAPSAVPRPRKVTCAGPARPPTGGLTGGDADASGKSEVELVEVPAPAVVVHPVRVLPACVAPEHARIDDAKVQYLEAQLAWTCAENKQLHAANMHYVKCLLNVRQHVHAEEAEFLTLSNKLYAKADDWAVVEREVGEFLREEEEHAV
ncbi:hypothetical protein BDR05DRAFT_1003147 [Suillus weaverae]|nr:hypothetical protein BDR05DRAFT_1003147 [Suillus weaverae]